MAKKRLKPVDKYALQEWDAIRRSILDATPVDLNESEADKRKRITELEASPEKWFEYYFPSYYTCEPAPFHKRNTKKLI